MTKNNPKDPLLIRQMFGKIADRYDITNGVMSFQMHKYWNRQLAKGIDGAILLDLCAGTGEIAYRWLKQATAPKKAFLLDVTPEMLRIAESKKRVYEEKGHVLTFITADAAKIPLESSTVDAVSVAYGIRNIQELDSCFNEVRRVLKPGGTLSILELTEPTNPFLQRCHRFYLNNVLPHFGKLVTSEKQAYDYLASSIQSFIKPEEIKESLLQAGFSKVTITPLTFGVATIISAKTS